MRRISLSLMLIVALLAVVPGVGAQDGMQGPDVIVTLAPTPFAEGAGLAGVTGWAHVVSYEGRIHISLQPNGAQLPEGTVLEGWVVDAGLDGGPGVTNVTDDDEVYGTSFGEAAFDQAVEAAPYALSTGVLTPTDEGTWDVEISFPAYNFSPYDAVVITLESDGNTIDGFDPRPGTPVFAGAIAEGEPAGDMMGDDMSGDDAMMEDDMSGDDAMMEDDMSGDDAMMEDEGDDMAGDDMSGDDMMEDEGDDMAGDDMSGDDAMMEDEGDDMAGDDMSGDDMMGGMMGSAVEVTLAPTPLAEGAGLAAASGTAQVYVADGLVEITINLNGAVLPEGAVLEGWVVDAGLNGGPGTTNVTDDDELYGVSFGEAAFDTLVESAPYALSTGVAYDNMDGTLTLSFHIPAYNLSPYDAVVVTLESDGNTTSGFDPRPGTPVLAGEIAGGEM